VSTPPEDRMTELRQLFFETADELVQKLNDEAMRLEKSPGDTETARSLRRTVHTLKGDSAACGFRELSELAHEFEDVLTLENTASAVLVPEIALRAADVFAGLLKAYRKGTKLPAIQALRSDIARLARPVNPATTKPAKKKAGKVATRKTPWSEYEQLAISRAAGLGKRLQHVVVKIDALCSMPLAGRQMIQLAFSDLGEVLALYPPDGLHESSFEIEAVIAGDKSADQIQVRCSIPTIVREVKVKPVRIAKSADAQSCSSTEGLLASPQTRPGVAADSQQTTQAGAAESQATDIDIDTDTDIRTAPWSENAAGVSQTSGADNLLRVDAERIDSVLNLVGELILAKSMLQQTLLEFGQRFPKDVLRGKFADAMAFQGRVLNDLQHSVMKIRMVPVDQLFRRFPRIVRDVSIQCGKEVALAVRGGQTDLDKSILDAIAEPLTHLVRNAIGHGFETADERIKAGKRPQGTLRLGAYHQGNQVVIEISDDGRGIQVDKVRQRALAQGLLSADQAARLTEAETLDLILQAGFSTADEITELSGRGVGLDVVQSVLTRLKGTVEIETAAGRGTTFRLRLPLTLAIIRALMFRVEQRLYALPLNAVAEIARTFEGEIHQVEHYDVLQLRNDVLPLLRLGSKPPIGPDTSRRKAFVLVIHSGERKFGVIVDGLEGEDELVIKALDDQSITTDLISGASILGDGRVVLILNMIALMERFTRGRADLSGSSMTGLLSSVLSNSTENVRMTLGTQVAESVGGQA
jgi:two-component system chemotaxis sensor kinase CheA